MSSVRLDNARPDGTTLRQHLEQVRRVTGKTPPELHEAPIPVAGERVFSIFRRLSLRRPSGGMGASAIPWEAIQAFQGLTGVILAPWEVEAVERLDMAFLEAISEVGSRQGAGHAARSGSRATKPARRPSR